MSVWDELKHFTKAEFGPDADRVQPAALLMLDHMRELAGVPMEITSAWRDVPAGQPQGHHHGYAFDVRCHDGATRFKLIRAALAAGFVRIGAETEHVHVDCDPSLPQEVLWVDVSR